MEILDFDKPYIISVNTLILQMVRKENRIKTLIIERGKQLIHPRRSIHLIRASCLHYGTTLDVATHSAKQILNNRQKVPIVVAVDHGIPLIMIPTLAADAEHNTWISFHAIMNFRPCEAGYTIIELTNNYIIRVQTSETTVQRQIALAYLLQKDYQNKFVQFNRPWIQTPTPTN